MKQISFPAIVSPVGKNYRVDLIDFKDVSATGKNIEQACSRAQLKMLSALKTLPNAPKPTSDCSNIPLSSGQFILLLTTDISTFKDTSLVKKNLTIPAWLNNMAIEKDINFSSLLQKALKEELGIID